jgi:hypothetical protein
MPTAVTCVRILVETVEVSAFTIPTDHPEADGTAPWQKTTLVTVEIAAGGQRGLGYTYADTLTHLPDHLFPPRVVEQFCRHQIVDAGSGRRALHTSELVQQALRGGADADGQVQPMRFTTAEKWLPRTP